MKPRWDLDTSTTPPSFLPAGLDRSDLVDVTRLGDAFRRYLDTITGRELVGAEYYAQYLAELEAPS